jgi:hypothetical protein
MTTEQADAFAQLCTLAGTARVDSRCTHVPN